MAGIGSTGLPNGPRLRSYLVGSYGLRSGWRLLIFLAILCVLFRANSQFISPLMRGWDEVTQYLARDVIDFLAFLLASWIMTKIEGRTIADYGLPWRRMFRLQFWQGVLLGFASLTTLLVVMRVIGIFYFGKIALHGVESLQFAGFYGVAFLIVGVREEFHYRGYGLFTLSKGIGFWPAAFLTAAFFGYSHSGNSGETWLGLFNASAGGLFFCFLLRRTGNLWMPIGFHVAWDWAQTFFYGVPDSGQVLPGHLFNGGFSGPAWLTGGSVGPEGSVLCVLLLAVLGFVVTHWLHETKYPSPDAVLDARRRPAKFDTDTTAIPPE